MKSPKSGKLALLALMVALLLTSCSLLPSALSTENALESADGTVTISQEEYDRLKQYEELDELMQIVQQYYYIEPDTDAMIEMAERGLLAGLEDPYTYFYNPEEYSDMWADDEGEYAGIGLQISASYATLLCTISRVFNDSPALAAGLRKGDILTKVDDIDVTAATLNEAVNVMRGEVGQTVNVQVQRDNELLDFVIPRAVVHVNWVSSCMLEGDIGYILLYEFSGDCFTTFNTQLNELVEQGAKGIILDLRDNPGGWIDDAVKIADLFLPEGTVTYLQDRDGNKQYYSAIEGELDIPLVLMLNENSASSSEVLAGAMQDYGAATIVGVQSYGKGVVQYVMPVGTRGAGMQVTAAQYFTPKGNSVHKVGITPDVEATLPEGDDGMYDMGDMADPQLQKAVEVMKQKIDGTFVQPAAAPEVAEAAEHVDEDETQLAS